MFPVRRTKYFHEVVAQANRSSSVLEILHRALVSLGGLSAGKRAEIAPASGLWVLLSRVQPIFPGF
jgi:hypothetical protein